MPRVYDVIIVGGGPAGLAAAHELVESGRGDRVLLLEAGRHHHRRPCPVDRHRRCTGCQGTCNVVSGFGGSMHYGDGVKLSLMPSGRRLIELFGEEEAVQLSTWAFDLLSSFASSRPRLIGHDLPRSVTSRFWELGLSVREYPVAVLAESELRRVIDGIFDHLAESIEMRLATTVDAAVKTDDGFALTLSDSRGSDVVESRNVIFATGRRGLKSTEAMLASLGVNLTPPEFSVGIRLEMNAELLAAAGLQHPDMKISLRADRATKVKTFCFCGGTNGGRIKFTNHQAAFGDEIITLDGHETVERVRGQRGLAGNFGLMTQVTRGDESSSLARVLERYRRVSNGRPVAQTYRTFRDRCRDDGTWPELAGQMPFEPSVSDLALGPVHELLTEEQHQSMVEAFERIVIPIIGLGGRKVDLERLADEVLVVGLELEFLWSVVELDSSARTAVPGLFVAGDSAGIAQGIVQAMMMGRRAATTIVEQLDRQDHLSRSA